MLYLPHTVPIEGRFPGNRGTPRESALNVAQGCIRGRRCADLPPPGTLLATPLPKTAPRASYCVVASCLAYALASDRKGTDDENSVLHYL
jgi:hypothetical protein